jgi:glyoxylase-like metal-dependent hydrolase (beta-lactamase superfamily II)
MTLTDETGFIRMLEISAVIMGRTEAIHPTLMGDADTLMLVDSGFPGQLALFREAMARAGVPFDRLTQIVITHQDLDHIGGLPAMVGELGQRVEVLASAVEKPYIQGEQRLVKLTPEAIERAVAALPPEVPEERRRAFRTALEHPPRAQVNRVLADGEELRCCGGVTVIATPGHTPGHICLYHRRSKTLIAGDALRMQDGELHGPDPRATVDMDLALKSLGKLAALDIERVICYHGGLYAGDASRRVAEIARRGAEDS